MKPFFRNQNGNRSSEYSLRGDEKPEVLIFTEGPSESYFLDKWLTSTNRDPNKIAVVCYKGDKKKLGTFIKNLSLEENFPAIKSFGFFLDAELKPANSAIHTIQSLLQTLGLIPANHALVAGSQAVGKYRIGIYVSPNNLGPGLIEDIVINEIAESELADCIQSLKSMVETKLGVSLHSKSLVQSYMGIRSPGLCGTGHGFNKSVLNVMHPAYAGVRNVIEAIL